MLGRERLKGFIVPYVLSYFMLMPVALAMNLEFSSCYYIFNFGSAALLANRRKLTTQRAVCIFFFIGIATADFDYLTYPIATFGIPACVYLGLLMGDSQRGRVVRLIKTGASWGAGYGSMWASKWIIGTAFTDKNVIMDALQSISTRTSNASSDGLTQYSVKGCIEDNLFAFFRTPVSFLVLAFVLCIIVVVLIRFRKGDDIPGERLLPYFILMVLPFCWYSFATNHSSIHFWFTNKSLVVFVMPMMCALSELVWDRWDERRNNAGMLENTAG